MNLFERFILLFLLMLLTSNTVICCTCIGEKDVKSEISYSDFVITGTVIGLDYVVVIDTSEIKRIFGEDVDISKIDRRIARTQLTQVHLKIDRLYKGKTHSEIVYVYTGIGSGDCGFKFRIGKEYIIYGRIKKDINHLIEEYINPEIEGINWTSICTRTREHNSVEINEIESFIN